ncbi:Tegument antigen [Clonorchis sinensis]|uniref:Tegument antigen n=1 Tax=Clonorchis sinensis TaxID=79923 RepID=A0A8T1MHY0_CLOSI|nr:Tegument antigen [Clonorchis sinensis]
MENFLTTFSEIDKSQRNIIYREDLQQYVDENELDEKMVERWLEVFDLEKTGRITLGNFCKVLGISLESAKVEQSFERALFTTPLDSGNIPPAKVIHSQMEEFMQNRVVRMSQKLIPLEDSAPTEVLADASKKLKSSLEHAYGSTWQVAIIEGSYWMTHTHSVRRTFHFRHGSKTIVVWQTPIRRRSDRTTS